MLFLTKQAELPDFSIKKLSNVDSFFIILGNKEQLCHTFIVCAKHIVKLLDEHMNPL